jgi:hypothetical protein
MVQDIIAYLIILLALSSLVYRLLRFFNLAGKKQVNISKCGNCTSDCKLNEFSQMKGKYNQIKMSL